MTPLAAGLAVLLGGAGLLTIAVGLSTTAPPTRPRRTSTAAGRLRPTQRRTLLISAALAVLLAAFTGWWLTVLVLPAAALGLPSLLRPAKSVEVQQLADLETWLRGLSGTLVGGGTGLEQAIRASLGSAPPTLQPSLAGLVARLNAQQPIEGALRRWADEVNHYTCDLVVACLILESQRRGGAVSRALDELADTVAELTTAERQIEADRSGPRTTARVVTIISVLGLAALSLTTTYISWYGTPLGQVIALVLLAAYGGCLLWMQHIAAGKPVPRFLPATTVGT
ncbi:type II secretion system F family protein [uncultured Cellulomonas sp.]|uniref:type II secretion system F family protein n=1 Tax=uncultured Cellulomonas sp. TaxID=189682 RepID=UPI002636118E|nr:type II secretion system F family protein [uncultured Cellulomonas sp.]